MAKSTLSVQMGPLAATGEEDVILTSVVDVTMHGLSMTK